MTELSEISQAMAEDAAVATLGSTYGYTDAELEAMPVWLVGVRLGLADGSDGYPVGSRDVMTPADKRRLDEAREGRKSGAVKSGRARPDQWKPRTTDPGKLLWGDAAR